MTSYRKRKSLKKTKIVFIRADNTACSYYRLYLPYLALKQKGYPVKLDPSFQDIVDADILILQRQIKEVALQELIKWKKAGKKIVIDFDDNFFHLDPTNPVYRYYSENVLNTMKEILTLAHAVTLTVKPLADSYARYNPNTYVLPNCVDEASLEQTKTESQKLTLGWQGSYTHQEDLRIIKSVINEVMLKKSIDFVLAGYHPADFFKKFSHRPWIAFDTNLSHYNLFRDFDVGLCPLKKIDFNESKSDIKFLEYSTLGIPTVASKIITYDTVKQGETGYQARNTADWRKYILELIDNTDQRQKIGRQAKEYVRSERTIQGNIELWEEVYENL